MSRLAYITQAALSKAYSQQSLDWMLAHWEQKGLHGCYPTIELYDAAIAKVFEYYDELDHTDTDDWRRISALKRLTEWKHIAKFFDTIITHPDYKKAERK